MERTAALPSGRLTFLFTDIEGSSPLRERMGERYFDLTAAHGRLLRAACEAMGGEDRSVPGDDSLFVVFPQATDAVAAAVEGQRALLAHRWPEEAALRVRIGIHTAEARLREGIYDSVGINYARRICDAGHGGQILLSAATRALVERRLPEGVALRDVGRHRFKGLEAPVQLFQVIHPDLPAEFPPLRSQPLVVHNLPQELTSFVGRSGELAEGEALLRNPSVRLVTLKGFGGLGKSRLAMRLAQQCLAAIPDGVWWIALEQARTGAEMLQRLAEQMALPPQADLPLPDQVHRFLGERALLLVLDNTEQVTDAAAVVRDLLAAAPGVKCLVTTRRALDLRGEHVVELLPMPVVEAETLFVERAGAAQPGFVLTGENRADVTELCRRLEGVPLAIELAAARGLGLTPRQMLSRLDERFHLLQSRAPDLSPRQRALRAAIDWSYTLLNADDQAVFTQLAVFAGGCTLEDAEAVCEGFDVFESVMELRRHSFLQAETDTSAQEMRLLMLESLRAYAAEKLAETEDGGKAVRLRHARRFLPFAHERLATMRTPGEVAALRELEVNGSNVRAAEQWAKETGLIPLYAELALEVGIWLQRRGYPQEAVTRIQEGLEALRPHQAQHVALAAQLLRERAGLHLDYRETAAARGLAQEALGLCAALGDAQGQAKARNLLGQAAMHEEQYAEAREQFARALEQYERAHDAIDVAIVRNNLGLVERRDKTGGPDEIARRLENAAQHLQEALRLRRAIDDRRGIAETLNNLGVVAQEQSDLDRAWAYYVEAIPYEQELRHTLGVGLLLANLGEVAQLKGDPAHAIRLLAVAERLTEEVKSPLISVVSGMLAAAAAAAGDAPDTIAACQATVRGLPSEERLDYALRAEPASVPT